METSEFDNLNLSDESGSTSTNEVSSDNNSELSSQFRNSPFGRLADLPGVNGPEDIFGGLGNSSGGSNPFGEGNAAATGDLPYGGNPFAGDNFWNIFAGGVNPSNPSAGGGNPAAGGGFSGGGNPMAGGGFSGGGNPAAGGGFPGGGNPAAGGGFSGGGNPAAGGGFSGGGNPAAGGGFPGGGAPASGDISTAEGSNSTDLNSLLEQSPFAPLREVLGDNFYTIFDNVGAPSGGQSPVAGSNSSAMSGNPFAGGGNPFAGGFNPSNSFPSGSNAASSGGFPIIGASGEMTVNSTDSQTQQSPFSRLNFAMGSEDASTVFGGSSSSNGNTSASGNPFAGGGSFGGGNPFAGGGSFGGGNPFAGGGSFGGGNPFASSGSGTSLGTGNVSPENAVAFANGNNPFAGGLPITNNNLPWPIGKGEVPYGNDNPDAANENVTVGNGNWYFASDNKTLGNGNWYYASGNATIGNGNWHFGSGNATIGNGNWYLGSDNLAVGNGNWPDGSDNTIMGNGNRFSGNDNIVVGSPLTNGRMFMGDGNLITGGDDWLLAVNRNAATGEGDELLSGGLNSLMENVPAKEQLAADIESAITQVGLNFMDLFSSSMTFDQTMLSQGTSTNNSSALSSDPLAPLSEIFADANLSSGFTSR